MRWDRRRIGERGGGKGLGGGDDPGEGVVEPLDDACLRAKIGSERDRPQLDAGYACSTRAQEQPDLRFAETVDRLHGIAHREYAAAIAGLPTGGQFFDELVLADQNVLEFVDYPLAST